MTGNKTPLAAALVNTGHDQSEAINVAPGIYVNLGVGNSYLLTTDEGNVIVNAGTLWEAERGRKLFKAVSDAPIRFVILTQSHVNQYGGVELFMEDDTKLITQREYVDGRTYWDELKAYYGKRSQKLWGTINKNLAGMAPTRFIDPDIAFDQHYAFELGGRKFDMISTPGGETTNALIVWLPEEKIAIVGNLFGPIFRHQPNLNTVRGDKIRSALQFIRDIRKVRDLEPEMILTGHETITGRDYIRESIDRIADSVEWIRNHTLAGMNAGKDVFTIMRETVLPDHLVLGEGHGKAIWNARAIWTEYTGWFDYDSTAALYPVSRESVFADLTRLAGGARAIAACASEHLQAGRPVEAIHLLDIALKHEPRNIDALAVKRDALAVLLERSGGTNLSETKWLEAELAHLENVA